MLDRGAAINSIFFYLNNFSMILWITSQKTLGLKHLQTDQLLVLLILLILQVKITVWKIRLKIIYALTCSCSLKWKLETETMIEVKTWKRNYDQVFLLLCNQIWWGKGDQHHLFWWDYDTEK